MFRTHAIAVSACVIALGCGRSSEARTPNIETLEQLLPVVPGTWRLDRVGTRHVYLNLASIVIAYDVVDSSEASRFRHIPPSTRTREDALRLAFSVAKQAAQNPDEFAKLARSYSDDQMTKEFGGTDGVRSAVTLEERERDVISRLSIDQTSMPFEAPWGFEIVKRLRILSERQVSVERIVFPYIGMQSTAPVRFGSVSLRTRPDARLFAEDVAQRLREGQLAFREAAREYSGGWEGENGGDLGALSTHDGGALAPILEQLAQSKVGRILGPYDTVEGYQIFRRAADTPRKTYAASIISLDPSADPQPLDLATKYIAQLEHFPERFSELQRRNCNETACEGVTPAWSAGSGPYDYRIERALDTVEIGQVYPHPVPIGDVVYIVRREDPSAHPRPPIRRSYELPNPRPLRVEEVVARTAPGLLVQGLRAFTRTQVSKLDLSTEQRAQYDDLMAQVETVFATAPIDSRAEILATLDKELLAVLGQSKFARFKAVQGAWILQMQYGPVAR